jgi:hypothetical protein
MMLRKRHKWIMNAVAMALMLAFIVAVLPPAPTYAQEQTITVSVDGVFVYQNPDVLSPPVAVLSLGATLTVLADAPQNGFNRVRLTDGTLGWAQVNVSGVPGGATAVAVAATSGGAAASNVIVQSQGNVRIRDRASINGTRIGFIGWGEQAFLLATDASGDWIQINYNGIVGWSASAWFVVVQGDAGAIGQGGAIPVTGTIVPGGGLVQALGNIRIRNEPSINGDRLGFVPWGGVATLLGVDASGDWININYNGLVGWSASAWWSGVSGTVVVTPSTTGTTTTAIGQGGGGFGDLILYNGPNENALAIAVIANGTPFTILESGRADGFTLIQLPDGTSGFVQLPATASVPVTTTGGTTTTSTTVVGSPTGIVVQALGNIRVRDRASINGARVTGLAWGQIVPVLGTNPDRTWLLIAADGLQGWVAVEWFTFVSGSLNQVPVVQ